MAQKRILVVDDEERVRMIYSKLLNDEGYAVNEAANVMDANDILKAKRVDLVLLDIKIPELDGSEMFEIISIFHKKAKVVVCSSYTVEEQKKIIKDANDYYDKSYGLDAMLEKVKKNLQD